MADSLDRTEEMDRRDGKEIYEWWGNLQEDFKRLNQNYQDYLREFYSGRAEKLLKSVEFVVHKGRFIAYMEKLVGGYVNERLDSYLTMLEDNSFNLS